MSDLINKLKSGKHLVVEFKRFIIKKITTNIK